MSFYLEKPPRRFSFFRVIVSVLIVASLFSWFCFRLDPPQTQLSPLEESESLRLGTPPEAPEGGSYAFERLQPGSSLPVAYDPCQSIRYVVNRTQAPPGTDALVESAFARLSAATGLQFVFDGDSSEIPSLTRESYYPELYGDRWAPVLLAWTNADDVPELGGPVLGLAGSTALITESDAVYVTGVVELDAPELTELLSSPNGASQVEATILHELAHLVGLSHVDDANELMNPTLTENSLDFGTGDRRGLSLLGSGRCFEGLDDPSRFRLEPPTFEPS